MRRSTVLLAAILCCVFAPAAGFADEGISYIYRGSILTILEDNGLEGDPAPMLPVPGFAVSIPLNSFISFDPGADFYVTYYGYSADLGRAVPVAVENRSASVWALMLTLPLDFSFRIAKVAGFHASVGLTFDLRLPLVADGLDDDSQGFAAAKAQTEQVASYFWGGMRWVYPQASFGFDFPLLDRFYLGAELRAWYPLYRLWTGENLPATENLRFAIGLLLTYSPR